VIWCEWAPTPPPLEVEVVYVTPPAGGDVRSVVSTHTVCVWLKVVEDVSPTPLHPGTVGFVVVVGAGVLLLLPHAAHTIGVTRSVTVVPAAAPAI
jgi:hypothetical protein